MISKSILLILLSQVATVAQNDVKLREQAHDHYVSYIFSTVAARLEEDISEKSMLDSDARILIETVASQLGECHLNAMSAFGPKFHDQAIRILARGDEPRELTRLVIDNMEKGPPADAMLLDYKERLDNCTLRVNLEHDVNYF